MTVLRSIFLLKEGFEIECANDIVKMLKSPNGPFSRGCLTKWSLAVMIPGLFILAYLFFPNSLRTMYWAPVRQGEYKPRLCSSWKFMPYTDGFLKESLYNLEHLGTETGQVWITGNHIGIPFCVIQYQKEQMLNPQIIGQDENIHCFFSTSTRLCAPRPKDQQKEVSFTETVTISWVRADRTQHNATFTPPLSYELQMALLIINGEDICNDKDKVK